MVKPKRKSGRKVSVSRIAEIRVDVYGLISDAVTNGLEQGWNRAHKHTDTPPREKILEEMDLAIMNAICEYLHFGPEE
jgi:hypothetical protein